MNNKPNIVLIMADQWKFDTIGALGHPCVKTPNIDKIIEKGIFFSNCYCNSPLCAPSRAVMNTGSLVRNNKVYDNASILSSDTPTLMHHLRLAGYETVLAGKMHFIGPDQLHGFEKRLTTNIYPSMLDWVPDWEKGAYPNYGTSVRRLKIDGSCKWNMQLAYDEEVLFRTLELIRDYGNNEERRPLFLCTSFTNPHEPYTITEEYWNMYEDIDIPMPKVSADESMHPFNEWLQIHHEIDSIDLTSEDIKRCRRAYYGMVSCFDKKVGEIVSELKRQGVYDNTLIIITSDHGDMLGEHGMWFKRTFYDHSSKVPFIVLWPGVIEEAKKIDKVISLVDLCPTLMKIANTKDHDWWIEKLDGDSFDRLLINEESEWKDEAVIEYYSEGVLNSMTAIRRGKYKYVYVHKQNSLLYDLENDPNETIDLANNPDYASICDEFKKEITNLVDFDKVKEEVLMSQKNRKYILDSLKEGLEPSWDYNPEFDPSKQYVRFRGQKCKYHGEELESENDIKH